MAALTRAPGSLALPLLGVLSLLVSGCWSLDNPIDPKRCASTCGAGQICWNGECVTRDSGPPDGEVPDLLAPDMLSPDTLPPECTSASQCDDKLSCTDDTCPAGSCVYTPQTGSCAIDKACHSEGTANPKNSCQKCVTAKSQVAWTDADGDSCDDKQLCTHGDKCKAGVCAGTTYACDDKLTCTTDTCNGKGPPDSTGCVFTVNTGCVIDKTCVAADAIDAANKCQQCKPTQSSTAWTLVPLPGCVITVAGTGTAGSTDGAALSTATFNQPYDVALNTSGDLYVADTGNHVIREISNGQVTTIAGVAGQASMVDGAASTAKFNKPTGVVVDAAGTVYVADYENHRIRSIAKGQVDTESGMTNNGKTNGQASQAQFWRPQGLDLDRSTGGLYIADSRNNLIRLLHNATVSTAAGDSQGTYEYKDGAANQAQFRWPMDVAVDKSGAVYIADTFSNCIRCLANQQVDTIAGVCSINSAGFGDGAASAAKFNKPEGIAVDANGNVYVADTQNSRIRKIASKNVTTLAGTGTPGVSDGPIKTGSTMMAQFSAPVGLAVDGKGNIYVADTQNNRIRIIVPAP